MAKYGRKTKLTPATVRDLCAALSIGAGWEVSCAYARVSRSLTFEWRQQAAEIAKRLEADSSIKLNEKERKLVDFLNKIEDAMSSAAIGWLQVVDRAALNDPAYALKMLRIRYHRDYQDAPTVVDLQSKGMSLGKDATTALLRVWGEPEKGENRDVNPSS